ncbi:DUF5706 domain-containing protein [Streptomyces sp. NBC_00012]|uniref:Pycsar system effector family protein n=1 Tax=unclassified Streptomyces TaxID=2593676 RepID=UPI003250C9CA
MLALGTAAVLLLLVVMPRLSGSDRTSFPYWAQLDDDEIRACLEEDTRAARIRVLSGVVVRRCGYLRHAVRSSSPRSPCSRWPLPVPRCGRARHDGPPLRPRGVIARNEAASWSTRPRARIEIVTAPPRVHRLSSAPTWNLVSAKRITRSIAMTGMAHAG